MQWSCLSYSAALPVVKPVVGAFKQCRGRPQAIFWCVSRSVWATLSSQSLANPEQEIIVTAESDGNSVPYGNRIPD